MMVIVGTSENTVVMSYHDNDIIAVGVVHCHDDYGSSRHYDGGLIMVLCMFVVMCQLC